MVFIPLREESTRARVEKGGSAKVAQEGFAGNDGTRGSRGVKKVGWDS